MMGTFQETADEIERRVQEMVRLAKEDWQFTYVSILLTGGVRVNIHYHSDYTAYVIGTGLKTEMSWQGVVAAIRPDNGAVVVMDSAGTGSVELVKEHIRDIRLEVVRG